MADAKPAAARLKASVIDHAEGTATENVVCVCVCVCVCVWLLRDARPAQRERVGHAARAAAAARRACHIHQTRDTLTPRRIQAAVCRDILRR